MSALSPITLEESKRLVELEEIIEKGVGTFIKVGEALAEIKTAKLYKASHTSFEKYCQEEWGFTRQNAFDLIETSAAAENVKSILQSPDRGVVRPLRVLTDPEQQRAAMQEAVESAPNGKPTAKDVEAAVERVQSGETKAERIHFKPSNGLQYADLAISTLKKIQPNDTERKAALNKVLKFIQNSL